MKSLNNGEFTFSNDTEKKDFELLTQALNSSISGIIITDNQLPDNPIIYCNEAFEKISGYSRNEIIGHNCRFLQGKDRTQPARQELKNAITNAESCKVELRNYRKDGTLFWNELYMSPVKNNVGETTHFVGVQNDITMRRNAEQELSYERGQIEKKVEQRTRALKENEEYLASILQTVRESLMVLNRDLTVLTVNNHFLHLFKVSKEETEGYKLYDLGNGQWDIPKLKQLLEELLPTNNPVVGFEVEHEFPHIGKKTMLLNAYRIELEGEFKDRILLAIEDISERREIERRKDDFLSIASHELKTPLTVVKGYIQMITKLMPADASPKFKEVVGKADAYLERLYNLISELLDVSRIQTGNLELHKSPFDFDKMLYNLVGDIQTGIKSHRIITNGATNISYVGDQQHIEQVISNLLANAVKYSPDSREITVNVSMVSNFIKVSITDYGVGISDEDKERIFERFFRVGAVQKRFPGMGIGLYICNEIIKNHGGNLWVESEKGHGSTFSFTLPLD